MPHGEVRWQLLDEDQWPCYKWDWESFSGHILINWNSLPNLPLIFTSWPPAEHWQRTQTRCTTGACLSRGPAWGSTGKVLKRKLPGLLWVFSLQKLHAEPLHSSDYPSWKMTWFLFVFVWGSPREVAVSFVLGRRIKTSFDQDLWSFLKSPRFVSFFLFTAIYVLAWTSCDLRWALHKIIAVLYYSVPVSLFEWCWDWRSTQRANARIDTKIISIN